MIGYFVMSLPANGSVRFPDSTTMYNLSKKALFLIFTLFAVYFTLFVLAFLKMKQGYGLYSSKFLVEEI